MKPRSGFCLGMRWARRARVLRAAAVLAFCAPAGPVLGQTGGLLGVEVGGKAKPTVLPKAASGPVRKGFVPPGAPKSGPAPFLTEAVDHDIDTYSKIDKHLFLPTKTKVEQPFYDVPFAVHVPFEQPFEGGVVRVFFDVNIVWDEPERKAKVGDRDIFYDHGNWQVGSQGVYRLDSGALSPAEVEWQDNDKAHPMTDLAAAGFPVLLTGTLPAWGQRGVVTTVGVDLGTPAPRPPFRAKASDRFRTRIVQPLVLRDATPGTYAFWFTPIPEVQFWPPDKLRPDDTLRARIFVHYIVARREPAYGSSGYFYDPEHEFLWDGAELKSDRPLDPNLVRAHSVEIPLVLRRDGWVLSRVELRRNDSVSFADKMIEEAGRGDTGAYVSQAAGNATASGFTTTYYTASFDRERSSDPWPVRPTQSTTLTWDVTLPNEIPDGGVGAIKAKGSAKETGYDQDYWKRAASGSLPSNHSIWLSVRQPGAPDKLRLGFMIDTLPRDKAEYEKYWAPKLPDSRRVKYHPLPRGHVPQKPEEPETFWLFAKPFEPQGTSSVTLGARRVINGSLGPQPIFKLEVGPWEALGYYERKKDLDKLKPGVSAAAGPVAVAQEKDEFYKWFPVYSRLLREKNAEIGQWETEIAVEKEAMQQQRRTARPLLDAWQAATAGETFGDWFASSGTRAEYSETMLTRLIRAAREANAAAFAHLTAIRERSAKVRQAHEAIMAEVNRGWVRFGERHPELALWQRHERRRLEECDFRHALGTGDLGMFQAALARANLQVDSLQPGALVAMGQLQLENGDPVGALESFRSAERQEPANADTRRRVLELECALLKTALEKSSGAIAGARAHFYGYLKERGFGDQDQAWVGGVRARGLSQYDSESAWAVFTTGVTGAVSGLYGGGRAEQEARALDVTERDMTTAYLGAQVILRLRMRGLSLDDIKGLTTLRLREELKAGARHAPAMGRDHARDLGLAIHHAFQLPELQALMSGDHVALRTGLAKGYWNAKDVGNTWAEWVGDLTSPKNLVMTLMPMSVGRIGGQFQHINYWTKAEAAAIQGAMRTGYVDSGTMVVARMLYLDRALGALGATKAGQGMIKLLERSQKYQESLGLFGQAGWTLGKVVSVMALQGLAVHEAEQLGGPRAALAVEAMLLFGGDTDLLIKFLDGARISRRSAYLALESFHLSAESQKRALLQIKERLIDVEHDLAQKLKGARPTLPRGTGTKAFDATSAAGSSPTSTVPFVTGGKAAPKAGGGGRIGDTKMVGTTPERNLPGMETVPFPGSGGRPKSPPRKAGSRRPGDTPQVEATPGAGGDAVNSAATDGNIFADPRPVIPNGQPGNDTLICLHGAVEGAEQGSDNGAIAAAESLSRDLDAEVSALGEKISAAHSLGKKLRESAPTPPPPPRPTGTPAFASREAGNYVLAAHPGPNDVWVRAELAMAEGNFAEAEDLFIQMKHKLARDVSSGAPISPFELPFAMLERRIAQARALKTASRPAVNRELSAQALAAIPDSEVDDILALPRRSLPSEDMGVSGTTAFAGDKFVVKEMTAGQGRIIRDSDYLQWAVEGEIVSGEIARVLGFATPGSNVKVKWRMGANGPEMESAQMVYRRVMGTGPDGKAIHGLGVHKLKDAELHYIRDQIAEHRVLAILLGDYDRKPDNYMILGGLVHALDAGQADVRAHKALAAFQSKTSPISVEGEWGLDHWWTHSFRHLDDAKEGAKLQQFFLIESSLTHEHAAPALQRIKQRMEDPAKLAELRESIRSAYRGIYRDNPRFVGKDPRLLEFELNRQADAVIEAMQARLPHVEEAMKNLNLRSGRPRPTAGTGSIIRLHEFRLLPFPLEERLAA